MACIPQRHLRLRECGLERLVHIGLQLRLGLLGLGAVARESLLRLREVRTDGLS
jgi:hypothetical protein